MACLAVSRRALALTSHQSCMHTHHIERPHQTCLSSQRGANADSERLYMLLLPRGIVRAVASLARVAASVGCAHANAADGQMREREMGSQAKSLTTTRTIDTHRLLSTCPLPGLSSCFIARCSVFGVLQ